METSDLSFHSTEELVEELTRRTTFLGVIVHSEEEYRNHDWGEERVFRVRFNNNLDAGQASRLLSTVSEYIDLHHE